MIAAVQSAHLSIAGLTGSDVSLAKLPAQGIASPASPTSPFSDLLTDAIGDVNKLEDKARNAVDGLMTGTGVDIHQAMIASEKASMAFELALAVRNKAIQSYQTVMSMQF
jgi:flagellar hook-basal body complex protein FliE